MSLFAVSEFVSNQQLTGYVNGLGSSLTSRRALAGCMVCHTQQAASKLAFR
jgi:hypothetical protein